MVTRPNPPDGRRPMSDPLEPLPEVREFTDIEYEAGRNLAPVLVTSMVDSNEHSTRKIIKASTHYTDDDIDAMTFARITELIEMLDEHLEEQPTIAELADSSGWRIDLSYPVDMGGGLVVGHINMRRPTGRDMLDTTHGTDSDVRLIIRRIATLAGRPRSFVRKMAWCDIAACVQLFRQ